MNEVFNDDGGPWPMTQVVTINLEDYRLPKVFVVRVVGKDEKVAVRFQDGTTLPLDVLRRSGERGEAIPLQLRMRLDTAWE